MPCPVSAAPRGHGPSRDPGTPQRPFRSGRLVLHRRAALEGGDVVTSTPRNLLAVLPGGDLARADRLHLAGDPVPAAAQWQQGGRSPGSAGAGGWRGTDRRMLAELGELRPGITVANA